MFTVQENERVLMTEELPTLDHFLAEQAADQ